MPVSIRDSRCVLSIRTGCSGSIAISIGSGGGILAI